jgi:ubiquinone/menaquinone biosynthesis C-methylase UbiE
MQIIERILRNKIPLPDEFYHALQHALGELAPEEVFFLEYIALQLVVRLQDNVSAQSTILDIGSGHGLLTRLVQILLDTQQMYGIDIDKEAIIYAQQEYPSITFKRCESVEIPFADNFFDVVYAHSVLHHIAKKDHKTYFAEINRVLKPGGVAIIIELNPYNMFTKKTFIQNPQEHGFEMLTPSYTKKLAAMYGKTSVYYFGFFQQWGQHMRFIEPWLSPVPLGALYAVVLYKKIDL